GGALAVVDVVADLDLDGRQLPSLALGVHAQRRRGAGGERAEEQTEGRRTGVATAGDGRLVRDELVGAGTNVDAVSGDRGAGRPDGLGDVAHGPHRPGLGGAG